MTPGTELCLSETHKYLLTPPLHSLCTSLVHILRWHFEPLNPFLLCHGSDKHSDWRRNAPCPKIADHCPTNGGGVQEREWQTNLFWNERVSRKWKKLSPFRNAFNFTQRFCSLTLPQISYSFVFLNAKVNLQVFHPEVKIQIKWIIL